MPIDGTLPHRPWMAWILFLALLCSPRLEAEPIIRSHGYTPFGELKYPADFHHLDYVNPNAPRGGTLRLMTAGTFDTLNPYTLKGRSPSGTNAYVFGFNEHTDSLLVGADFYRPLGDEPRSAYGLIAESLEYPPSLDWVIFNLRPTARFNDGHPITADDVVFSFRLLREEGHPRYALMLEQVTGVEKLGRHRVRFTFGGKYRRDLPLVVGQLPVLPKHYWQRRNFAAGTLEPPVVSNPYRIVDVRPGRQITLERDPDYWARDLPVHRGRYNFDRVIIDFYRDAQVGFEAFKSGGYDVHVDYIAKHWATAYDFPAVRDGRIRRKATRHAIPQGTQAFFFNTRRAPFDDVRVREALGLLFDFEWVNRTIFNDAYKRMLTWFPNSPNSASGIPQGRELALLAPYRDQLPAALFERPFTLPVSDGSGNLREQMRAALALLQQAGYRVRGGTLVHERTGQPLRFEILLNHNPGMERVIQPWLRNMERLGIRAGYRTVDPATYQQRMERFDYDVTVLVLSHTAFPGPELIEYFHSSVRDMPGGRNYAGIADPVVDAMLEQVLAAPDLDAYRAAIHALDRVLLWRHYVIPHWYLGYHRIAWWDRFGMPDRDMPYTLGTDTWWSRTGEKAKD